MTGAAALVGIASARQEARLGLARGGLDESGSLRIERVTLGSAGESAAATVAGWLRDSTRYIVALDAPLGWPASMGHVLSEHQAGCVANAGEGIRFHRDTDRFVAQHVGRTPPEVGAHAAAHSAVAALALLGQIRQSSGLELRLAWDPHVDSGAIETFPVATLRGHGFSKASYRGKSLAGRGVRERIVDLLETRCELWVPRAVLVDDVTLLDAALGVMAAADFVRAQCEGPPDIDAGRKEGWIWFKAPQQLALPQTT